MQRLIAFIFVSTIQYPRTLKNTIYHLNNRVPPPFFHSDTNLVLRHVLIHSVDKNHVVVVAVEISTWLFSLNILFFWCAPTPSKSLKLTRLKKSYVNHPAAVLINHCQSYSTFLFDVRCCKWPSSFLACCLATMIAHLRILFLLITNAAGMLLTPRWVSRRKVRKTNTWILASAT